VKDVDEMRILFHFKHRLRDKQSRPSSDVHEAVDGWLVEETTTVSQHSVAKRLLV